MSRESQQPERPKGSWLGNLVGTARKTKDGDTIAADIGEHATGIAVGKNIIQIGSIEIPRWLLIAAAFIGVFVMITAVYISGRSNVTAEQGAAIATRIFEPTATPTPNPTSTPSVMGDHFNIAIASLSASNHQHEEVHPEFASSIGGSIANYMSERSEELVNVLGQSIEVWGPDLVRQVVTSDNAKEIANSLNADVLVYGTLNQLDDTRWALQPAFFLSEDAVQKSVNLGGEYPLGEAIEYRTNSSSSLRDINSILRTRLNSLMQISLGISYISRGNQYGYQEAAHILKQAVQDPQVAHTDRDVGQEVLYHFLGASYFLWATLLDDDNLERRDRLTEARTAYENALVINPQFVRSNNGLGSTLFQISRPLTGATSPEEPCAWKWDEFDAAREQYRVALEADSEHKPPSGYVNFNSHFGLGRIYFYQGYCRSNGNAEVAFADWQKARDHYNAVLGEYVVINQPMPTLQNLAAYAKADLGQLALIEWDYRQQIANTDQTQLAELLTNSIEYMAEAVALDLKSGTEPGQKHAISVMPNYLTALCQQQGITQIELVLDEFLEQLPNPNEAKHVIIPNVLPSWESCTNDKE